MGTEDFLGCLSKAGIEKVGSKLGVLPRPRAKDTRAQVIEQGPNHGEENGQEAQDSRRPPVDDADIPF
jgi:hypothetical protein